MAAILLMKIFFWISIVLLVYAIVYTIYIFKRRRSRTKGLLLLVVLLFGSVFSMRFAAGAYLMTGVYDFLPEYAGLNVMEVFFDSVVHGLQSFSMDEDYTRYLLAVRKMCGMLFGVRWMEVFSGFICSLQNVLAPIVGGAVLLDILSNIFPVVKLVLKKGVGRHNFFVFSELNKDAVYLAEDILRDENYKNILRANAQNGSPVLIFTDVYMNEDEEAHAELKDRVNALGGICTRTDYLFLNLRRARCVYYFLIDKNRMNNLSSLAAMAERAPVWRVRRDEEIDRTSASAYVYVFTEGNKSGAYIRQLRSQNREKFRDVVIREVHDYMSMAMNLLYDVPLYAPFVGREEQNAGNRELPDCHEEKKLVVTLLGSGRIAEEMFRNVFWFGQLNEYRLVINVLSKTAKTLKSTLMRNCEEMMRTCDVDDESADEELLKVFPEISGKSEKNPPYGEVHFIQCDVENSDFYRDQAEILEETHYFIVILGDDRRNMEISAELNQWIFRRFLGKERGFIPLIACAVYDDGLGNVARREPVRNEGTWVVPFGSYRSRFSCKNIFLSDFTERSLASGELYNKRRQEKDEDDEYKTLSSVARVAHASYKYFSEGRIGRARLVGNRMELILSEGETHEEGILPESQRPAGQRTEWVHEPEMRERLAWLEHRRWNAYIRSQGYAHPISREQMDCIYRHGEKGMNPKRVDLKIHPCLVEAGKGLRKKGETLQGLSYGDCDMLDCLSLYLWSENQYDQGGKKKEELTADDFDYKIWDYPEYDTALTEPGFIKK